MLRTFATLLAVGLAVASPSLEDREADPRKLIIGAPFQILTADFDGKKFTITGNSTTAGAAPSWLLYKQPRFVYAVDENANDTSTYVLGANHRNITLKETTTKGATGVVHLGFNADQTVMLGAGYGSGLIDAWNVKPDSGALTLVKQINVTGGLGPVKPNQAGHHPHQALIDPSGRFFLVPNLGGDAIEIVDTQGGRDFNVTRRPLLPGSGPRHGAFISDPPGSVYDASAKSNKDHPAATYYYVVVCELSNEIKMFRVRYGGSSLKLDHVTTQSTYGPGLGPANATSAAAGEVVVARNGRDVYVSNRLSGNATDSLAHFVFDPPSSSQAGADAGAGAKDKNATLTFADAASSGGILPRMFSLSADEDEELVFVANQGGAAGLLALRRDPATGKIDPAPVAAVPNAELVAPQLAAEANMGPYFVQEIV